MKYLCYVPGHRSQFKPHFEREMPMTDIRYIQRFENFEKSFLLLRQSLEIGTPSIVEKAGVIQFFEICFELSWKLMKDYLEFQGYEVSSPREAIKRAFSTRLRQLLKNKVPILQPQRFTACTFKVCVIC